MRDQRIRVHRDRAGHLNRVRQAQTEAGPQPGSAFGDIGGQLDFRLNMLSTLDLTLSVGGAIAFEEGVSPRREAMISLKVLR